VHRLVSELQALVDSDLAHPAIAAPLAANVTGVEAYLAMDFVAAESVDKAIRAHGPTPAMDVLRITTQMAGALDFAADARIAHGAVHPRDLLVSADDARMTGFGIARALERIGVGVPVRRPYTAPERVAAGSWDRRADIFSLAAVAHELLWGRRVTAVGDAAAGALTDVAGFSLETLQTVFARALAEKPADRFETATAFAEGLQAARVAARPAAIEASSSASAENRATLGEARGSRGEDERPMAIFGAALEIAPLEEELCLPFEPSDPDIDFDVARVLDAEEAREPDDSVELDIAQMDIASPLETDEYLAPGRRSIPVPPPIDVTESVLARSRSAVWPLPLALAVGVAVGFALGYGVAERPPAMTKGAHSPLPAAAATSGTAPRGVSETEVSLNPSPVGPDIGPPVAGRPGSARPTAEGRPALAAVIPEGRPDPATSEPAVRPASARPPAVGIGRILVRSTPAGATAFVDGKDVGRTPVTVRDMERGAHTVRVARDGFRQEERRVSVTSARPAQSVTIDLARERPSPVTPANLGRANAPMSVESRPPGASVFLDGKLVGQTPLTMPEVPTGDHSLAMDLSGYRHWSASVRVVAGERVRITASLER
jgi:hypothetical protein